MNRFRKMVAIEPTKLLPEWDDRLRGCAESSVFYEDIPTSTAEIVDRIGDADCVLLSYTSQLKGDALRACPQLRYVGMCCSLYSPESANVDILTANELGIVVTGARDYGDIGVREYVVHALVGLLQGRGAPMWKAEPMEIAGLKVGMVGMGTLGSMVARALWAFDADLSYFSRTRKPELEAELSCGYRPLDELLSSVDVVISCLNKNVILLGEEQFETFGPGKIFMNVSISPGHEIPALGRWLDLPGTYALGDSVGAIGVELVGLDNVLVGTRNAGLTFQAKHRLGSIVVDNIKEFLAC